MQNDFERARELFEMARDDDRVAVSDVECNLLGPARYAAADALFLIPAPNMAALAYKLEIFASEDCFNDITRDQSFAAIIRDARRFADIEKTRR